MAVELKFTKGQIVQSSVKYYYLITDIMTESRFDYKKKDHTKHYFYVVRNLMTNKEYPVHNLTAHKRYKLVEDQKTVRILYGI